MLLLCGTAFGQDVPPSFVVELSRDFAAESADTAPLEIWSFVYRGSTVYYVAPRFCCDLPGALYDGEGKLVCRTGGGIAGNYSDGNCLDFYEARTNGKRLWQHPAQAECASIFRYDEARSRIFVVCPTVTDLDPSEIDRLIADIFEGFAGPPDEYFISFFAYPDLVGYEDDERLLDSVQRGDWAEGFVGEYYTYSHEITLWPRIASKRVTISLPAP